MGFKRLFCLLLAVLLVSGCTPVVIEEEESSVVSAPKESEPDEAESVSEEAESEPLPLSSAVTETSEVKEYSAPEIFGKDYAERAAYFGDYWEVEYSEGDSYFNNSVFIGNSIMAHFKNYVQSQRAGNSDFLGNASFFAGASFSFYNNEHQTPDSRDCALPLYAGQAMNITDAVGEMNVATVYLSLMALNDIAIYSDGMTGINETYNLIVALLEELKELYPGTRVVILSNTYLHSSSDSGANKLNNGNISDLNIKVLNYCNQNGYDFIDVSSVLLDGNCLGTEFCSDVGSASFACHLTSYAYNAWTYILRDYAAAKRDGIWKNPEYMKGLVSD